MDLLYFAVPTILIITGIIMLMIPTSTVFAFKTKTASKNERTQEYCNVLSARIMIALGIIAAVALVLTRNAETGLFGFSDMGDSVMPIMLTALVVSLPVVNFRCRRKFRELFDKEKNGENDLK